MGGGGGGGAGVGRVLEPKQYARLSNEVKYKKKVEKGAQSSQYFTELAPKLIGSAKY